MSYIPKTYRTNGGDTLVVASGGKIELESGGTLEVKSGATLTIADGSLEAADVALTEGNMLKGNATNKASGFDTTGDGKIVVGDGTTVNSVAVTGDVTISNAGVTTIEAGAVEDSMIEGLAAGEIILGVDGTAANNLKAVLSGDATMDGTGAVTIGAEKVTPAKTSGVAVLYNLGAPDLADVDLIVTSTEMKVGTYTVAASPDVPRNITVTVAAVGTADTMGTITVVGTNYADAVIEEEITPAAGSTVAGAKAFKTVTTVTGADWVIDAVEGTADTIEVGIGDELGCHAIADATTDIMLGILGVTITAHNPTIASPVTLEGSTVDMSAGTYDGTKVAMVFQKN